MRLPCIIKRSAFTIFGNCKKHKNIKIAKQTLQIQKKI
jgi:hypothetical protein